MENATIFRHAPKASSSVPRLSFSDVTLCAFGCHMEAVRRARDLLPGVRCEKIAAIRDLTMKIRDMGYEWGYHMIPWDP